MNDRNQSYSHQNPQNTRKLGPFFKPDGSLILFFEDDGAGIPGEMKEEIFQPAFQKTRSTGLFLAREILEITEIAIRETGVPTRGARFELLVPKGTFRYRAPQTDDKPT